MVAGQVEELINGDASVLQQDILNMEAKVAATETKLEQQMAELKAAMGGAKSAPKKSSAPKASGSSAKKTSLAAQFAARNSFAAKPLKMRSRSEPRPAASQANAKKAAYRERARKEVEDAVYQATAQDVPAAKKRSSPKEALLRSMRLERSYINSAKKQVRRNKAQRYRERNGTGAPDAKFKAEYERMSRIAASNPRIRPRHDVA
jgi:hypothetical protein